MGLHQAGTDQCVLLVVAGPQQGQCAAWHVPRATLCPELAATSPSWGMPSNLSPAHDRVEAGRTPSCWHWQPRRRPAPRICRALRRSTPSSDEGCLCKAVQAGHQGAPQQACPWFSRWRPNMGPHCPVLRGMRPLLAQGTPKPGSRRGLSRSGASGQASKSAGAGGGCACPCTSLLCREGTLQTAIFIDFQACA